MADSIIKKVKGLFMSKNKKKEADIGSADDNSGFEVLTGSQAADADVLEGGLDESGATEDKTLTEAAVASEDIPEKTEEIEPETAPKAEKTHEKVARIAAEMNTKGYGL